MRFSHTLYIALLALILSACHRDSEQSPLTANTPPADLTILGATIYTVAEDRPHATALVVRDGRFIYVGDDDGAKRYRATNLLTLNGELIIPGLIDGHAHPGYVNVERFGKVEGETPEALLESVQAYAAAHPDQQWLRLCCWPTNMFVRGSDGPRKEVLDAVAPGRLVWFESETAHDFWLNSNALLALGVDKNTPDPKPGLAMYARDDQGEPTGWVKEGAGVQHFAKHFAVTDATHLAQHKQTVAETLQILSKHGVTALFDAGNKGYGDHVYNVISELEKEGRLPLRYYGTYQIFTPERAMTAIAEVQRYQQQYGGELLQFNAVKVFMDGISANQSAAYSQPYLGSGTSTEPLLSTAELTELLMQLHEARLDLMVHSIGDLATQTVLDAVEQAQANIGQDFYPRVTIAHLALIDPADIPRIHRLGIIANFSPWWFGVETNDVVESLLGKGRYSLMYRARSVVESGARVTYSSDEWWGGEMLAAFISPYLGMQTGHTRQYPVEWWQSPDDGVRSPADERLSLEQLLRGYTQNGAYQLRLEDETGSISAGKSADFIVLNKNLFNVDPHEIWQLQPTAVVMRGQLIQGEF
ncbi:hypothetical protein A3709_17105 [Halioglobus sp. HI00S01]|uniref:amidohydrolase n=1 Tax=Halioglobus sp. HI00S01 TaxID=1822214 RepID=UPI0007C2647A|nr:amidohydrolase [Halioglobus sp. HI00S01]KZX58721.1 hypothetical protein A3709_17105 [Halioglobus sp. HI00S01]